MNQDLPTLVMDHVRRKGSTRVPSLLAALKPAQEDPVEEAIQDHVARGTIVRFMDHVALPGSAIVLGGSGSSELEIRISWLMSDRPVSERDLLNGLTTRAIMELYAVLADGLRQGWLKEAGTPREPAWCRGPKAPAEVAFTYLDRNLSRRERDVMQIMQDARPRRKVEIAALIGSNRGVANRAVDSLVAKDRLSEAPGGRFTLRG